MAAAEEVYGRLLDVYRRLLSKKSRDPGGRDGGDEAVPITFIPDGDGEAFARRLVDVIRARGDGRGGVTSFEEGRVFCYNCESTACGHAAPPSHLSVFQGYTPTGLPLWNEFISVLHERRDERIDDLVDDSAEVVALWQKSIELKSEQLRVFGRTSALYDILGQVVAGYLPLPRGFGAPARNGRPGSARRANGRGRMAVTVQIVRCLTRNRPRLRLNVIGRVDAESAAASSDVLQGCGDLVDLLKLEPERDLEGLFRRARRKLEEIELKLRSDRDGGEPASARSSPATAAPGRRGRPRKRFNRGDCLEAVTPLLTRLARGIESIYRRRRRRTRHASDRREARPAVGLALKDLENAHPDRVLFDELEHTFIAVGPKWRVHVFGRDGRHVTSLVLSKEGFQKRIATRRWRYTTRDEMDSIRRLAAGQAEREGN
jgi:hypothetical protein